MTLKANERFLLERYREVGGRGLDYGCGAGDLVGAAAHAGHDFWGAESYYGDEDFEARAVARAPAGARGRIRRLGPGFSLPFEDGSFDFVCSNQVIEHVEDLETTLDELARVTRRGGVGIHVFPVRETLVEPHLGVPLYHRVPEAARRPLARAWHGAGRANFAAEQPDFARWWADMAPFYDDCVFLRPAREVERAFARRFTVTSIEREKLSYHRRRALPAVPGLDRLEHRRVGMAIQVRKR